MPIEVKIWDRDAEGGPAEVAMFAINAREAVKRDPKRYTFENPNAKPPKAVDRTDVREAVAKEIPSGWDGLSWPERRKLALQFGAEKNVTSEIANAIIAAEVKRRAVADVPAYEAPFEPMTTVETEQ